MASIVLALATVSEVQPLRPVGRWFFSTKPVESETLFTSVLGAEAATQNISQSKRCAEVTHIKYGGGREYSFIHDKVKPSGAGLNATKVVDTFHDEFVAVGSKTLGYTQWEDNHDGLQGGVATLDVPRLEAASEIQIYPEKQLPWPEWGILRIAIPGTYCSLESAGNFSERQWSGLRKHTTADPDDCRNNSWANASHPQMHWWKSTFAAPNPQGAADFAVAVLGGAYTRAPYPLPDRHDCTTARWVVLPSGFMLHFVNSWEWPGGAITPGSLAKHIEAHRDFRGTEGVFDVWAYSNMVLWAEDSLDPYIARAKAGSYRYLLRKFVSAVEDGAEETTIYAMFVHAKGNGLTFQVRAKHLTESAGVPLFDACDHERP